VLTTTESPRSLKQSAIDELSDYEDESKRIRKAIREIEKSLDEKLWVDADYLDPKHGKRVFHHEHKAVKELMKLQKPHHRGKKKEVISDDAAEVVGTAIEKLVRADKILATTIVNDADALELDDKKFNHEIDKAWNELGKGNNDFEAGKFDKAIHHYQKAWHHAQKALHHAQHPRHHHHKRH
jgi:tetratricopeptide (TPR) repeat protein